MWCADRDHGQLHRGASSRRVILPRAGTTPACRHRSACATSPEQGVSMKLPVRIAPLLFLVVLLAAARTPILPSAPPFRPRLPHRPPPVPKPSPTTTRPTTWHRLPTHRRRRPSTSRPSRSPTPRWASSRTSRCPPARSEEHTSELQSLMRISYAVFCLKKKK